jgi:hydrophobic/amphiphilic exporter-1 (mainly G- bacteria), HAE1 family
MNVSRFTVGRPIFTTMATLIVIILGLVAFVRLPIDLLPDITFPSLTIVTSYENASPEEMEELVTRPIEEAVMAVPGVEEVVSTSAEGASTVRVSFVWGTNIDVASNDIRDRLDRILNRLPDDADRPFLRKFDVTASPIMMMGASSRLDPMELRRILDQQIQPRLERVPGVAGIDVWGGLEREIRIEVDPDRLRAFGLSLDQVMEALRDANVTVPAGDLDQGMLQVTLRTPGLYQSLDEVRQTVVAIRERAPVYLAQVADVRDTHREITRVVRIDGNPGVRLAIRKQSGTNTVEVAQAVLAEMARVNADFPHVQLVTTVDSSEYIRRSINNVIRSIVFGGSLAVVVLLFFLRSVLSTLVISTAIPISIIATFALIYFGGFTLNLMTLGGLALGVGMMVDNAIVVLENIFRHREAGKRRKEAAEHGAGEVTAAIIASTLTTLVIFLPLIFVEGVTGILFRQLAYIVGFSLICSLVAALTLVPMLASHLPKPADGRQVRGARFASGAAAAFGAVEKRYGHLLHGAMQHRALLLGVTLLVFLATFWLLPHIGREFMPASDEGEVRVNAEMAVGTRTEVMDAQMHRIERIVLENVPEARTSLVNVGASQFRPGSGATGEVRLSLVPMNQRTRSSEQIAADLRSKLQGIPGVTIRTRAGQGMFVMRILSGGGDERLQIEVRGFDIPTLDALAASAREAMVDVPGITDVRVSREAGVPQQLIVIDREKAADFGLSVARIARVVRTAVGGSTAGQFRERGDEVRLQVRMRDAERMELEDILDLTIPNPAGEHIALRSVVELRYQLGPAQIERKDQQRVVYVSANLGARDLGSVAADVRTRLAGIPLPAQHNFVLAGDYEDQQRAFRELMISLLLSLLLVYMVMACLYESLRDPLVVMFSVPLAAIGAIVALFITGSTFNVQSLIGLIMLGGIVVNNAILIVDQATRLRRDEGWTVREAAREAGRRRLRPILMTSLTTMLALLPLALGMGEGAEAQAPLARAVIGGLFSSTFITLFVIPAVYSFFHRDGSVTEPRGQGDSQISRL